MSHSAHTGHTNKEREHHKLLRICNVLITQRNFNLYRRYHKAIVFLQYLTRLYLCNCHGFGKAFLIVYFMIHMYMIIFMKQIIKIIKKS